MVSYDRARWKQYPFREEFSQTFIQSGFGVVHFGRKSPRQVNRVGFHWLRIRVVLYHAAACDQIGEPPEREIVFLALRKKLRDRRQIEAT